MLQYIEDTLDLLLNRQRGQDVKLFHKDPAFKDLAKPSIEITFLKRIFKFNHVKQV